ncbi:hypothetical protein HZ326_14319 [Fusarium oxysporum f. sp. albedinis]|nr:hypothetical protein HZ326_14319 [Fusarium oxysporum f. sp. albedinis]
MSTSSKMSTQKKKTTKNYRPSIRLDAQQRQTKCITEHFTPDATRWQAASRLVVEARYRCHIYTNDI